jgi:hypothetical protein
MVMPHHATMHPAKYANALISLVRQAGATIVPRCRVEGLNRESSGGFTVTTSAGSVRAREVIVATNGYTGAITPWQRRRVIPIGSYIIATEELDPKVAQSLSPHARAMSDTRRLVFYYRLSPDRRRMLFGGRVAYMENDPRVSAPRLHARMTDIYPQLRNTKVSHSWVGFVAYTFDTLRHRPERRLYYAMGYCGSVSGCKLFRFLMRAVGKPEGKTPFDDLTFQTSRSIPLSVVFGASIMWYRLLDRLPSDPRHRPKDVRPMTDRPVSAPIPRSTRPTRTVRLHGGQCA